MLTGLAGRQARDDNAQVRLQAGPVGGRDQIAMTGEDAEPGGKNRWGGRHQLVCDPGHACRIDAPQRGEGEIGPLWPYPGLRVQDNRIPADGRWVRIPEPFVFRIDGPSGHEMFKAIATAEPADFSPLLDRDTIIAMDSRHEPKPPGAETPLGRLLRAATMGERSQPSVAPGKWATAAVVFEVTEPQ